MVNVEKKILQLCQHAKLKLAFAESCTGGALAARLTKIPGASKCFAGSIVSYQNSAKMKLLGVLETSLEKGTAVSTEVATQMLIGTLSQFSADIGVATTGIAGPDGGTPQIPVGTVFIAIGGKKSNIQIFHLNLVGSREEIIQKTIEYALVELLKYLENYF